MHVARGICVYGVDILRVCVTCVCASVRVFAFVPVYGMSGMYYVEMGWEMGWEAGWGEGC